VVMVNPGTIMHHHEQTTKSVHFGNSADIMSGSVADKCVLVWLGVFVSEEGLL